MKTLSRQQGIYVTDEDRQRLLKVLRSNHAAVDGRRDLAAELRRATSVAGADVPPDVITMHSTVRLVDLDTGQAMTWTLVFPEEADASAGKISVMAPLGTAMLGYRQGDGFEWEVAGRPRRFRVDALLYQPEGAGEQS